MSATYSPATIKRARTILARCEQNPKRATVKRAVKAQRDDFEARLAAMKGKKSTVGQMRRINAQYEAQGLREFASLSDFRKVFPLMTDAAIEYRNLRNA